jgi:copper homeostasis protein
LLAAAGSLEVTFHRAFDMTRDLSEALEDVVGLGIRRILTSGGQRDAPAGAARIAELVHQAKGRVSLMPGGGVTDKNVAEIVAATGATEIHLSARDTIRSAMVYRNEQCFMGAYSRTNEYEWREASAELVRRAKAALMAAGR